MGDFPGSWWLPLVLAPFVGSFLGVLIGRLPRGEPVAMSRSRCSYCHHTLSVRDLIPLVSWISARRRCRYCGSPLSWFYPNIEVAALVVAAWAATETTGATLWASCILGWALLALAVIDAREMLLPDLITLPLVAAGLGAAALLDRSHLPEHVLAAALGFAVFWLVGRGYRMLRGREGLGRGDAKLLAAAGAWVSWQGLPGVVLLAAALGLVAVVIGSALGSQPDPARRLPFGPWLCLGTWVVWLYGPVVLG